MIRRSLVSLALLAVSTPAFALTCDEIMNMADVNVPESIIVQTMESSGTRFTASDQKCLADRGASDGILAAAKKMSAGADVESDESEDDAPPDRGGSSRERPTADDDEGETFDSSETLGGDVPSGEDSGEEDDGGGGPAQVEDLIKLYRAKKVLTASKGLYDLLEENAYPDEESKISYYLAKSLMDMGMYHSAQHYFMEVVRKGPKNPYFKYALPKLVAIAELTGDDTELMRIVDKIPPEAFPRQAKNHLYYLMGRKLYEDGKLAEAAKYFQQVSSKSDLYLKAKYYEGVIHNERGKLKSAVKSFRDVYQSDVTPVDDRQLRELEDLKDLALMNIARIYFGIDRFDNADNFYALVDRDSTYWPESLYERAWTNFWKNDLNLVLGLLLTVRSPYYADIEFLPETTILRALTFFNLCEHDEVERILLDFEATYKPMRAEIKSFTEQYATEEGRKLSDQAFDAYFELDHDDSALSKALFLRVLRNQDLSDIVRHLEMLEEEEALIDAQKDVWQDSVGQRLKEVIAEDRLRYKRKAGLILLQELADQYDYLGELMTQSEIIRFEVVDAQRLDYEFKMQNPDVETADDKKIDFSTSKEIIYWPFNGEFWQDELGYYRYTEESSCNTR